jgi:hypothetical protein
VSARAKLNFRSIYTHVPLFWSLSEFARMCQMSDVGTIPGGNQFLPQQQEGGPQVALPNGELLQRPPGPPDSKDSTNSRGSRGECRQ